MKLNFDNVTSKIFNFYAAPFRLLNVFINRCKTDLEKLHADAPSVKDQFSSPHFQSCATNARCLAIVSFTTLAAISVTTMSPLVGLAAYTAVSYASTRALKVEKEYQARKKEQPHLTT